MVPTEVPWVGCHDAAAGQARSPSPEACFEPVFDGVAGFRRVYPDFPGMGRTVAPEGLRSAEDVLDTLLAFTGEVTDGVPRLLDHYPNASLAVVDDAGHALPHELPDLVLGPRRRVARPRRTSWSRWGVGSFEEQGPKALTGASGGD